MVGAVAWTSVKGLPLLSKIAHMHSLYNPLRLGLSRAQKEPSTVSLRAGASGWSAYVIRLGSRPTVFPPDELVKVCCRAQLCEMSKAKVLPDLCSNIKPQGVSSQVVACLAGWKPAAHFAYLQLISRSVT